MGLFMRRGLRYPWCLVRGFWWEVVRGGWPRREDYPWLSEVALLKVARIGSVDL